MVCTLFGLGWVGFVDLKDRVLVFVCWGLRSAMWSGYGLLIVVRFVMLILSDTDLR